MPYKSEKIKLPRTNNKTVKIPLEDHKRITELYRIEGWSYRKIARFYDVSHRLIIFIVNPDKLAHAKELYKERRKDGRYYNKEKHTLAVKKHRRYKHDLFKKGIIS